MIRGGRRAPYNSVLREICGEVLRKSMKPRVAKKILDVDRERICGNKSCSLDTCNYRRVESVENLELLKPVVLKLLLTVDINNE
jgi:hypothetical protein